MRQAGASFLLLLIVLSWLGSCRLCYEETYHIRLTHRMNAREAAITQQLQENLRRGYLVKAIPSGSKGLRGQEYSGDFVFSGDIQGDTVYYLLVDENRATSFERVAQLPDTPSGERDVRAIWLKNFFKDYIFNDSAPATAPLGNRPAPAPSVSPRYFPPAIAVAEPPPNFLA